MTVHPFSLAPETRTGIPYLVIATVGAMVVVVVAMVVVAASVVVVVGWVVVMLVVANDVVVGEEGLTEGN